MIFYDKNFPNESKEYRTARNKLLEFEIKLRSEIEQLGKMRQALPLGGLIKEDYEFIELHNGTERRVKPSELFLPGKNSLIIYSLL